MGKRDRVEPRLYKGLRDLLPRQAIARGWMVERIRGVYERYGFTPIETPAIERMDALSGSGGEEAQQSIFGVVAPDEEALGLRFDLTVPLARVVAQYQELPRPFRRYQVASVWRADKPEKGRFREFTQFDLDSVGTESELADVEIMAAACDVFDALGVACRLRFSSRRILDTLLRWAGIGEEMATDVFRVLDKLDKVGIEKVKRELTTGYRDDSGDTIRGLGLGAEAVERIERFLGVTGESRAAVLGEVESLFAGVEGSEEVLSSVGLVSESLAALGYGDDRVALDVSIARGLAYYTGPVFEANLIEAPEFGSVFGGGRYDGLVSRFSGERIPATGGSIGVDRLLAALEHLGRLPERRTTAQVLVTIMDKGLSGECLAMASELRRAGINTELYLGNPKRFGRQLKHADQLGVPIAIMLGSDEHAKGVVTIKDLEAGMREAQAVGDREEWLEERPGQFEVARGELVGEVRGLLEKMSG